MALVLQGCHPHLGERGMSRCQRLLLESSSILDRVVDNTALELWVLSYISREAKSMQKISYVVSG